jgi:hypothetical protein
MDLNSGVAMTIKNTMIILLIAWILPAFSFGDMCSWVDKDGVRHFSNTSDCKRGEGTMSPEAGDSGVQTAGTRDGLRFMGVYRYGIHYIRFYGDGTVVSVLSPEKPEKLAGWFGKSAKHAYIGNYSIKGGQFRFYARCDQGILMAEGYVKDDGLIIAFLHNRGNPQKERSLVNSDFRYYMYIPVEFPEQNRN